MYRNCVYNNKERSIKLFGWDGDGNRKTFDIDYSPYLMLESNAGHYDSIFDTKLIKKVFKDSYERNNFIKNCATNRIFENFAPGQQYLIDTFWRENNKEEFTQYPLKEYYIDIECYSPDEFPKPEEAKFPVNVITVYDNLTKTHYTWGTQKLTKDIPGCVYKYCNTEEELFKSFIIFLKKDYPDVLSGWNTEGFDIPYLINRSKRLLGEYWTNQMSPVGSIYFRTVFQQGRSRDKWYISGVSLIDYLDLYKRFCMQMRDSYRLDNIANIELNESKVEFGNMNLAELSKTNWDKFVEYNIQDVEIIVKLETKLQYLKLLRMLSHIGLTTLEGAMGTVQTVNGASAIQSRINNKYLPTFIRDSGDLSQNAGAYVSQPEKGFQTDIVSFDATSLYPSVMISLNISPETKWGSVRIDSKNRYNITLNDGRVYTLEKDQYQTYIQNNSIGQSGANILFKLDKKGIIPSMLEYYFDLRIQSKNKMIECKKKITELDRALKKTTDPEIVKKLLGYKIKKTTEAQQWSARQMSQKIYLNSVYGQFGNRYAVLGDDEIAESVTLTGQAVIKKTNDIVNEFINGKINKTVNSVIYNDTDSVYITLKHYLANSDISLLNDNNINKEIYSIIEEIQTEINDKVKEYVFRELGIIDSRFEFKREVIATTGMFFAKKRYALHIKDNEGVIEDKYKYTGIDIVRSTMPKFIKPYAIAITNKLIDSQNIIETNKDVFEAYEKFIKMSPNQIAFISGISNIEKYLHKCDGFKTCKGMPKHVKSAYYWNMLLKDLNLNSLEPISSGDKVRYIHVHKPNRYNIETVGFKYSWPKEFDNIFKIDYDIMFEKLLYKYVTRLYSSCDWVPTKPTHQAMCNLEDLFG